jgi:hypothetical protein
MEFEHSMVRHSLLFVLCLMENENGAFNLFVS